MTDDYLDKKVWQTFLLSSNLYFIGYKAHLRKTKKGHCIKIVSNKDISDYKNFDITNGYYGNDVIGLQYVYMLANSQRATHDFMPEGSNTIYGHQSNHIQIFNALIEDAKKITNNPNLSQSIVNQTEKSLLSKALKTNTKKKAHSL